MPTRLLRMVFISAGLAGVCLMCRNSSGALSVILSDYINGGVSGTPDAIYNYSIATGSQDGVLIGDYFRIYDVAGLTTTSAPMGWTATRSLVDSTPPPLNLQYGGNPLVYNVTFTYTGAYPGYNGAFPLSGFICNSLYSNSIIKDFIGQDSLGNGTGAKVFSIGPVAVPAAVPEPGAAALLASAAGLLAHRRRVS